MRDLVERIVRRQLLEYDETIANLVARIEDLERRLKGVIRAGQIVKVDPKGFVTVKVGRNETPPIRWIASAAGEVSEYRPPSVGEQALVLNFGGGNNSRQAFALGGVWSDEFPVPVEGLNKYRLDFGDGSYLEKDDESGDLRLRVEGNLIFDVENEIQETATKHVATKR